MSSASRLRVLCLHGYKQHDIQFKNKTNALRKSLKDLVDFHYVTAPHKIPFEVHVKESAIQDKKSDHSDAHESKQDIKHLDYLPRARAWWRSSDDGSKYNGIEESLQFVSHTIKNDGPFDGILGFSQGGVLSIVLCLIQKYPNYFKQTFNLSSDVVKHISDFKFVWIISGFLPRCDELKPLLNDICDPQKQATTVINDIPLLLVMGTTDKYVSKQKVLNVTNCFDKHNVCVVEHNGGHYVPSHKDVKQRYVQFLSSLT
eukprot:47830_1